MKKIHLLFFIAMLPIMTNGQSPFSESDLQGEWQHSRGYTIKIENTQAKISKVKDPFPAKVIGGIFYSDITYVGDGVWTAQNTVWQWRVNDIQNGWWKDMGKVNLKLSSNKMTLSDGSRSFIRTKSLEEDDIIDTMINNLEPNSKKVYNAYYGSLSIEYIVAKTSSGKILVHIKGKNNSKDAVALLKFESNGNIILEKKVNPGEGFGSPLSFTMANLTVSFEAFKTGDSNPDLIQILRKKFEEELIIKDNELKIKSFSSPIGGARG